jgi:hypothetical protein
MQARLAFHATQVLNALRDLERIAGRESQRLVHVSQYRARFQPGAGGGINDALRKTMIAQNIAHQAILAGHSVLFTTAAQMLLDLGGQESSRSLERRLRHYAKQSLLIVDELGYLAFDNRNADLLFQVVSRRYERKSLVLTTNLAFKEWPTVFPNATCATALIDRVIHHSDVISVAGKSYRLREAEDTAAKKEDSKAKSKK